VNMFCMIIPRYRLFKQLH